ncbi:MAG TPA: AMP-binding protein [Acidimicrobiales bacterium]|nr:AMP-binding protein [Acidimicrobiales bacterium]
MRDQHPVGKGGGFGLSAHATRQGSKVALVLDRPEGGPGEAVTYAELEERVWRLAAVLAGMGVGPGDRVGILVPNSIEWFEAVHAAGRLGALSVPVNVHFKAAEAGWVLSDSGSKLVVAHREFLGALAEVPGLPRLVVGEGYAEAVAAADPGDGQRAACAGPDDWPVAMVYTSGTTGKPKGVVPGSGDLRRSASAMAGMIGRWGLGSDDVHLMVGPAYHSGPGAWAQAHLAMGATVVVMPRWDARRCLEAIEEYRVTSTHMVPSNFVRILDLPPEVQRRHDLSSLKVVVHAAAPCPVPVKRAFMDLVGPGKVFEYFGATEGGGTRISPEEWLAHPGSVGRPFPGNEVVILDDQGNRLPPGQVGQIYMRTSTGPFSYHGDPEKTAAAFRGELFSVGDVGYLDEDGYLYITDRKADMVISGGVNIYPREIEDVLYMHPDIADCAVFGVPDPQWGEVLKAMVQCRSGRTLSEAEVVSWCRQHLADYKRPRLVEFVDELPRDPNGKVAKHRLRQAARP